MKEIDSITKTHLILFAFAEKMDGDVRWKDVVNESFVLPPHVSHFLLLLLHFFLPEEQSPRHQL